MSDFLVIDRVCKSFGTLRAVDHVSLEIARGEIFSLLGPSGCGKTTLLRMLAGFERPDSGRIVLRGQDITALAPERRPLNTVFQSYALFPHLDVWDNIAFGLRMKSKPKPEIRKAVERMLALVRLEQQAHSRPSQLSGGQKQRVAIARALVNEPEVLLLDEPLAALDLKLRQHMLSELGRLQREVGTTFVYVTHDQDEALSLSHRVAVMNQGRVEQVATPRDLYQNPANASVAGFIGDANFFPGVVVGQGLAAGLQLFVEGLGRLGLPSPHQGTAGTSVQLMMRPESLRLSNERPVEQEGWHLAPALVEEVIYCGAYQRVRLKAGGLTVHAQQSAEWREGDLKPGLFCWLQFPMTAVRVFAADDK